MLLKKTGIDVEYNFAIFVPSEEKLMFPSENSVGTNGQQKKLFLK